tara:strand:+ start:693 stop:1307 length:615 start_codon:yes stop_codon:yes gene_type:complete
MAKITIGIIDYGAGNISRLKTLLASLGFKAFISSKVQVLDSADVLLLPGVGAFPQAMYNLRSSELDSFVIDKARSMTPILGICLGMQLLCSMSDEIQLTSGLNLLPANVKLLRSEKSNIGWSKLFSTKANIYLNDFNGEYFYFNHSYEYIGPSEYIQAFCLSPCSAHEIAAVIKKDSLVGIQFHPEKSQQAGLNLLKQTIHDFF